MRRLRVFVISAAFVFTSTVCRAKEILTNQVIMPNAPHWLNATQVEKVANRIQYKLEWSTRRVKTQWYTSQADFEKVHGHGSALVAATISAPEKTEIHLGPKVQRDNFDAIFGHELVHVIIYQKYKSAIPKWLEEGLANHLSKSKKVDYKWLAKHPFPKDVKELAHPLKGDPLQLQYRYRASQALAEMLDRKCGLDNLIRLSVERKMENYIKTYCEIDDLNQAYQKWVKTKAALKS
ncbi:MAG: hypothetical protein KDD59_13445 [Bdellovibrionales bacterium]|nr:hypothetical protein [Bdellovibrionales bacterium]